jgi:UDP-N-acetylmuramoyl-tripeptide--D-alanyl-D-alanine ligase
VITTVAAAHLQFFGSVADIATAKAEIFLGLEPGGAAVINRDNPHFARLQRAAKDAGVASVVSFGEHAKADARVVKFSLQADTSTVQAKILGADVTYKLGAPGRHLVFNSLAVLAAASLAGADLALAALALSQLEPVTGRGARLSLDLPGGTALLIDESYNANPASMRAALALLGQAPVGPRGRRIAVLGEMLELGARGTELHSGLLDSIVTNSVDLVFCAGALYGELWEALPSQRRGGYAETAAALEADVLGAVRAGDAIMVKGSLGSRMGPIVKALTRQFSSHDARAAVSAQG